MEQSKFLFNVRRVIGIKGRITIPFRIRRFVGIKYNDVLSFSLGEEPDTIVIKKLKLCNNCCGDDSENDEKMAELQDFLKNYSSTDINRALKILEEEYSKGDSNG